MAGSGKTILVFGATGQQGGSVAAALLAQGHSVRALVRDPFSDRARALGAKGVELVRGDLADVASIDAATNGADGVFSVQPSSGQGELYGVTDDDEVRFGVAIADAAKKQGVSHFVYSSSTAVSDEPSGVGHFDSKAAIERHIRSLAIDYTIVRPATFMEMLAMPGFGLPQGVFTFFVQPDQQGQYLAVRDIGLIVAAIFADPARFAGKTFDIASDALTGAEIAAGISRELSRPITYVRFPDEVLAANPFLAALTRLVDSDRLTGHADLPALRGINPALLTFDEWLAEIGRPLFVSALKSEGG